MADDRRIQKALWILVAGSLVLRVILAAFTELGNDEVYYWTYAKFPGWSQFDHPSMVGWMIQLFTLNLTFTSEFFLRLPSVIFGTLSTLLIYQAGKRMKNELTGLYAAFLFTASFYCFIISGTFIMPDTPQVFFWLAILLLLMESLPDKSLSVRSRRLLLLAGFTTGLALLSKYHSAFLISGTFLYMLIYNRRWFRAKEAWIAFLIAAVMFIPVIIWNYQNDFVSFTYHENRIGGTGKIIRWDYFLTEIAGQIFYNNPVNFILVMISFTALITGRKFMPKEPLRFLLLTGLPLALIFLIISLFRPTLPHWTGPAYLGFILVASAWLDDLWNKASHRKILPWPAGFSVGLMLLFVVTAFTQIRYGWIPLHRWKAEDVSTQLFGWKQLGTKFRKLAEGYEKEGSMPPSAPILTFRWFPAANFDYYVSEGGKHKVYAIGDLERIHKYYWIDRERGDIAAGTRAYYIALSDDFQPANELFGKLFEDIPPPDTLAIMRGRDTIREAYVYRLAGLKQAIPFR